MPGTHYWLAIGEQKEALFAEESTALEALDRRKNLWTLWAGAEDNGIAVTAEALQGVDLWADPTLTRSVFLSDRLAKALKAAKLTRRFGLRKCRVVAN